MINKSMKQLLKEAHDHGFSIGQSMLRWSQEKSWTEFLKQNNIPLVSEDEIRDQNAQKAMLWQKEGMSLRAIASLLGYDHPQSVKSLIEAYKNRIEKRKKLHNNG